MSSPNRRRELDVMKLMMQEYDVNMNPDDGCDFTVIFKGPSDTHYEGGIWTIRCALPQGYPYKSPSIGFTNKIYHPNIDESSGSVCLDVINQTWTPMYDLVNIFESFLPQLLAYPNPTDPLNGEAASLLLKDPEAYGSKVKEYVAKYASVATMTLSESDSESEDDDFMDEDDDEDNFFR